MQAHRQVLTPEQKLRRAETAKAWRLKNAEKLKEYQHNRQIRDGVRISETIIKLIRFCGLVSGTFSPSVQSTGT